jgi:C1A family cysteine protease
LFAVSWLADDGRPLGLLPNPHDLSHLRTRSASSLLAWADLLERPSARTKGTTGDGGRAFSRASIESLPAAYDLRARNKLTAVRNQGTCGSCWAFATMATVESFLTPSENRDFSEQHLIDEHGYDNGPCNGGQIYMSTAYLSRWSGPVNEADDPFAYSTSSLSVGKHVQDVILLPPRQDSSDNALLKDAVMNYGAVYATMYYKSSFYNSSQYAYYNSGVKEGAHAVAIVGWDDNFDRNKFSVVPADNGAFIAKNSWGADWGEGGYFYVSYYDKYLGADDVSAVIKAEAPTNYEVIYQYDPLGWVNSLGYGSDTGWFANIFTSGADTPLTAVGFYSASTSSSYGVYVYTDVTAGQPRSGSLVVAQTGILDYPGYFTIPLNKAVPLRTNELFAVVARLTTPGYDYPIPCEQPEKSYTSRATAGTGESFVSEDGDSWDDLAGSWNAKFKNTNVCLKAYAGDPTSSGVYPALSPPSSFQVERLENNFIFFKEYINRLTWQAGVDNTKVTGYRIYRTTKGSGDGSFQLLAEVSSAVFTYDDRGLGQNDFYAYHLTVTDAYGRESEAATAGN